MTPLPDYPFTQSPSRGFESSSRDSRPHLPDDPITRLPNSLPSHRLRLSGIADIAEKLEGGERLDADDGRRLFESPDLLAVGWLANREREKRHGDRTFFNHNIRLEATNVCVAGCLF